MTDNNANPTPDDPGAAPSTERTRQARQATGNQITVLGVCLIFLGLLLAYAFVSVWPADFGASQAASATTIVTLLGIKAATFQVEMTVDARLMLTVMIAGGLGSFIHTATSFGDFVGNEKLTRSWLWWYILKPFIGMMLAVVFYLVVRGGFLSGGTSPNNLNLYGIAALAGMAGMFSKQATDKLSEVFNTLFKTSPGGGDSQRRDDLGNLAPVLTGVVPPRVMLAATELDIEITGAHFSKGAIVRVNNQNRLTEFKGETRLRARLLPEDVAQEGHLEVTVFNPPPGGGASPVHPLPVASGEPQA
jgi:hypothetical protein